MDGSGLFLSKFCGMYIHLLCCIHRDDSHCVETLSEDQDVVEVAGVWCFCKISVSVEPLENMM